jgi:hypothetical protein
MPRCRPTDTAATKSDTGTLSIMPRSAASGKRRTQRQTAGNRRGARAAISLNHVAIDVQRRSPSAARSNTARKLRPISR